MGPHQGGKNPAGICVEKGHVSESPLKVSAPCSPCVLLKISEYFDALAHTELVSP